MARVSASAPDGALPHIDALRGIAVLMVILCHHVLAFPALEWRWAVSAYARLGVQLFFVASAVTLCRSAERRAGEPLGWSAFAIRRFFRIAPLYYLALGGYAVVRLGWPGLTSEGDPAGLYTPANIVANLLFVHAIVPAAYNHVVPGGWSIGVEMLFYALIPALFAGMRQMFRRGGTRAVVAATALLWVLCVAAQVILCRWTGLAFDDPFVASSILNQLPVFGVGIAGYFAVGRHGARMASDRLWFMGLTLWVWLLLLYAPPVAAQIVPVVAAVSFVCLASMGRGWRRTAWLERVGRRSYSMYLLHFLPVWLVGALVERLGADAGVQLLLLGPTLAGVVAVTWAAAGWTVRTIERPGIALGRRLIARRQGRADIGCIPRSRLYGDALP